MTTALEIDNLSVDALFDWKLQGFIKDAWKNEWKHSTYEDSAKITVEMLEIAKAAVGKRIKENKLIAVGNLSYHLTYDSGKMVFLHQWYFFGK